MFIELGPKASGAVKRSGHELIGTRRPDSAPLNCEDDFSTCDYKHRTRKRVRTL